jgi:glycosyltransferase involved in cell wall biosynthesis
MIAVVPNGVDLEYNRTEGIDRRPSQLVFTGALTYEPNLDAMRYFLAEIFPRVLEQEQAARLIITGRTGGASLPTADGHVTLTGYLEDIRPMIASSTACVVPLRKGAGTRLKILEAMALGTPVVSTSKGAEGLEIDPEVHFLPADDPISLPADPAAGAPTGSRRTVGRAGLRVRQQYDWSDIGRRFEAQVESLRKAE